MGIKIFWMARLQAMWGLYFVLFGAKFSKLSMYYLLSLGKKELFNLIILQKSFLVLLPLVPKRCYQSEENSTEHFVEGTALPRCLEPYMFPHRARG